MLAYNWTWSNRRSPWSKSQVTSNRAGYKQRPLIPSACAQTKHLIVFLSWNLHRQDHQRRRSRRSRLIRACATSHLGHSPLISFQAPLTPSASELAAFELLLLTSLALLWADMVLVVLVVKLLSRDRR